MPARCRPMKSPSATASIAASVAPMPDEAAPCRPCIEVPLTDPAPRCGSRPGVYCLVLRGRAHLAMHRKVGQELLDFRSPKLTRMSATMKSYITPQPVQIGLFGPEGQVARAIFARARATSPGSVHVGRSASPAVMPIGWHNGSRFIRVSQASYSTYSGHFITPIRSSKYELDTRVPNNMTTQLGATRQPFQGSRSARRNGSADLRSFYSRLLK